MDSEGLLKAYENLIILQYQDKPKAMQEAATLVSGWVKLAAFIDQFAKEFDLDVAYGDRLDKIGKIVFGTDNPRIVPLIVPKIRFGFDGDPTSRGFDDAFNPAVDSAIFADANEPDRGAYELSDDEFRFYIKLKVAVNNTSAYVYSDERISINDVVIQAFDGQAYVTDNLDMSLTLHVTPEVSEQRLDIIRQLDLLPRGQGVRYDDITRAPQTGYFGFDGDDNSAGFSDAVTGFDGGIFAEALPI